MNMAQYIQFDYFRPIFDGGDNKKEAFLSKPEKVKLHIDGNGVLKVKGKRYLRLGKINLFDPVKGKNLSSREYVGILDTETGQVLCFDINEIYENYVQNGITQVCSPDARKYDITSQTKNIVMNTVMDQKIFNPSIESVDFV